MEDSWIDKEEFNFDIPLSPLSCESKKHDGENIHKSFKEEDDDEEEVFFGPVGVMERCAAAVVEKNIVEPIQPLDAKQRALLLKETAALSVLIRHKKPLSNLDSNCSSPIAVVHPILKKEFDPVKSNSLKTMPLPCQNNISLTKLAENKENSSVISEDLKSTKSQRHKSANVSGSLHRRSLSCPRKVDGRSERPSQNKEIPKLNSSNGSVVSEGLRSNGIPRLAGDKSKIARPSCIPSLKQGLLMPGQAKLRCTSNQESKLKPVKVVRSQVKTTSPASLSNNVKSQQIKSRRTSSNLSSNFVATPSSKESMMNSSDVPRRRRSSIGLNSSKLAFPKPTNNSTPLRGNITSKLTRKNSVGLPVPIARNSTSKLSSTPRRSIADVSILPSQDSKISSNNQLVSRRSFASKQLKQLQVGASVEISRILDEPVVLNTTSTSDCSILPGQQDLKEQSVNSEDLKISGLLQIDQIATSVPISSNRANAQLDSGLKIHSEEAGKEMVTGSPEKNEEMLLPEIAMKSDSPLLKFESPVIKADPFATGDTPPPSSAPLLSPELEGRCFLLRHCSSSSGQNIAEKVDLSEDAIMGSCRLLVHLLKQEAPMTEVYGIKPRMW
eukprot:gene6032-6733_t